MKTSLLNLQNQIVGEIDLLPEVFGVELREDIIKLVIDWQRAKARAGSRKTKTISEVSGTTKKPFKQKGTGNARQGSLRAVQMRGGGVAHGPVVRSHATKLPKKIRKLGLKSALSEKFAQGKLLIIDNLSLSSPKTSKLMQSLDKFTANSYLFIGGEDVLGSNFSLAVRNIPHSALLPQIGANVYDVVRHDCVFLSKDALELLQGRLQ